MRSGPAWAGRGCGVALQDLSPGVEGHPVEVQSTAVVNAAGVWSDGLRGQVGRQPRLRRLRGGHLLFPWERVPLNQAVSFLHPQDARPLWAELRWEAEAARYARLWSQYYAPPE